MPSITDMINEKYGVAGENIADALSKAAKADKPITNIADAAKALYEAKNNTADADDQD